MDVLVQLAPPLATKAADQQVFTGSGTWTKPSGFGSKAMAFIQSWGAGGGSARAASPNIATPGCGGAYKEMWVLLSSLGSTETVTIGAAGVGRTTTTGVGTAGGNTTFGSWLTAYGGNGGAVTLIVGSGGGNFAQGGYPGYTDANSVIVYDAMTYEGGAYGGSTHLIGKAIWGGGCGGDPTTTTGGTSVNGGNGGNGGTTTATAGTQPAGGGGVNGTANTDGKNGGAGKVVVTVFDGA